MYDQPQQRQARRRPQSPTTRAMRAATARAQWDAKRGYSIAPELWTEYRNAFHQLRKHGRSVEAAWLELRPIYAQGG